MPELPEVETLRAQLSLSISPQAKITKVLLRRSDIRFPIPKDFSRRLEGKKISEIRRRAKYLLFYTDSEILLSHLGMSGAWVLQDENFIPSVHDHCEIKFEDSSVLVFRDPRRFGVLDILRRDEESEHRLLKHLGPEPLESQFTGAYLYANSRHRSQAVKTWIMDQRVVVGVGNIYASEALFLAGLKPSRRAGRLTRGQCEELVMSIQNVLKAAIAMGGSTIRDYRSLRGLQGEFQGSHWVYDQAGMTCRKCGKSVIKAKVLGGRSTFWCPVCQK
jgi:formamidopyrimidine-DNA glycosylase